MTELTSRQRVRLAINHQQPDKIPIDFGAMRSTGINAIAYNKLKKYLGIQGGQTKVYDIFQQLAESEEEIMNIMGADVIQFGDDLGTQENAQISVSMYKDVIKPYHSRQYQYVRNNFPEVKVFLHSCGAIYDLIPDLIDAGVEILNPVQLSARNMDPVKLKKEFGKHLTFWGGGSNTQTTLPLVVSKKYAMKWKN